MKLNYFLWCALVIHALEASDDGDVTDDTGCPKIFQRKCFCGPTSYRLLDTSRTDIFMVNCTNSRFDSTEMLEFLPDQTEVLLWNGNNVPYLRQNLLGTTSEHEALKVIDMSNNNIQEISGKAFHKVGSVEILILNHNDLRISGEQSHPRLLTNFYNLKELHLINAFTELIDSKYYLDDLFTILLTSADEGNTALNKLHLEQNEIWDISNRFFCSDVVPSLAYLYLSDNQLHDLNFQFECIKNLRLLDVSYNKIKRLSNSTLQRIDAFFHMPKNPRDSPRTLAIAENPLVCDCYLRQMIDWLKLTRANLHKPSSIRCFTGMPDTNAGIALMNVQKLECPLSDLQESARNAQAAESSHGSGTTHTLLVILIILIGALLIVLLYVNRERIHSNVKPLIDNFNRSLQYRTIEKDLSEKQVPAAPEVNV